MTRFCTRGLKLAWNVLRGYLGVLSYLIHLAPRWLSPQRGPRSRLHMKHNNIANGVRIECSSLESLLKIVEISAPFLVT
jgi:hypothetical protein